jgi:hypothetical protein
MKLKQLRLIMIAAAALLAGVLRASAAEPSKEETAASARLLAAIEKGDYASFVADGTKEFAALPKEQFDAMAAQLGPVLKAGYDVSFLGDLSQKGFHVTLWKLHFKDGGDDALAELSMKDGKVGGYWIN